MILILGLIVAFLIFGVLIMRNKPIIINELDKEPPKKDCKYKDCDIEYYPTSKKYAARYKKKYIYYLELTTGKWVELDTPFNLWNSEEQAKRYLDEFLDMRGITSKIINLC